LSQSDSDEFSFDDAYQGVPPWDIGRPQKELVKIASKGELKGKILDFGCGTGENALYFASLGLDVVGADFSPRAIDKAKTKARERKSRAKFVASDALNPSDALFALSPFVTIVDCGLYHSFDGKDTDRYIRNLSELLSKGGTYILLCFSDRQEGDWGPRRIPKDEIRSKFSGDWKVNYIADAYFENNDPKLTPAIGAKAWLASITKV
jgi:cyclopropane fatty-acyl-phospholipid synthase-like methyltransferase